MSKNTQLTYYQKNRDAILSKAKDSYKNNSDTIKKEARDKYNIPEEKIKKIIYEKIKYNMTEEQENKRREYERNRHCNMTEEEKNKRREYARNRCHTLIKVC